MRKRRRRRTSRLITLSLTSILLILCGLLIVFYNNNNRDHQEQQPIDSKSNKATSVVERENSLDQSNTDKVVAETLTEKQQEQVEDNEIICPPFVSKNPVTSLSENYIPKDLKRVSSPTAYEIKKGTSIITDEADKILIEETMLVAQAADALDSLITAAKKEGIELYAYSGYRSYKTQEQVFQRNVSRLGKEQAERVSAVPGQSEHQTGLAMDITSKALIEIYKQNKEQSPLQQVLGTQAEGKWLQQNAYKYGFTMSYPEGKEDVTGYDYEPWHFFYVGNPLADTLFHTNQVFSVYASDYCL